MFLIPRKLIEGGDVSQIEISHSAGGMVAEERGAKISDNQNKTDRAFNAIPTHSEF